MKKILKYFLFGIVLCLGLVAFSFNDNVMPFICHAVNSDTCVVNFYSADNETILYSREVKKGTTLNEIKSRNLFNITSDLSWGNSSGNRVSCSSETQFITAYCVSGASTLEGFCAYCDPINLYAGQTYYLTLFDSYGNSRSLQNMLRDSTGLHAYYSGAIWLCKNNQLYGNSGLLLDRYTSQLTYTPSSDEIITGVGITIGSSTDTTGDFSFTFQLELTSFTSYEPYFSDFYTFISNRFDSTSSGLVLPSSYQRVDYIESSGTQFINTGFIPTINSKVEMSFELDNTNNSTLFGCFNTAESRFSINLSSSNFSKYAGNLNISSTSSNMLITPQINTLYNLTLSLPNFIINNRSIVSSSYTYTSSSAPIYIFARNPGGSADQFSSYKLYSFKIYDGGTLISNFVPCYRKSDNVIGLYDVISNSFFTNGGTGVFLKGNNYINDSYVSWSISPDSDSRFSFDSPINHDYNFYGFVVNGITYNYTGDVDARLSEIGDYAIKNIVSFNIDGYYLFELDFDSFSSFDFCVCGSQITSISSFNDSTWKSFYFNSSNDYLDLNFFVISESGGSCFSQSIYNNHYLHYLETTPNTTFKIYLSNLSFSYGSSYDSFVLSSNDYSKSANYLFDTNLNSLVDMSSDTNYSYQLIYNDCIWPTHNTNDYFSYFFLSHILNNFPLPVNSWNFKNSYISGSSYYTLYENSDFHVYNNNAGNSYSYYDLSSFVNNFVGLYLTDPYDYDLSYNLSKYYFVIDKPSYRVNNSLCIYNFDYYNTLSGVSSLTYELQKGVDYYDVTYVGSVPNSKFLYFDCSEIDNTIFDRYVFLYLSFTDSKINLIENDNYLSYSVGFDFNFIYYNQPLITSNGVYPYSFNVPTYKDMSITFSLVPPELVIPWNAIFYNGVVFLCFYMPLISDINNAIGLNYFIGALLNIINFVFDSAIGNFISACFAFLILFALIRFLFPFVYSVGKSSIKNVYNNSQFAYNRKRKKQDKFVIKQEIFEDNYKKLLEKKSIRIKRKVN